jgi:predicted metal-dependent hydrolase
LLSDHATLSLYVRPGTTRSNRQRVLDAWYRDQMKDRIPALLEKWQIVIGKEAGEWGVKRMKTRWGSCKIVKGVRAHFLLISGINVP